MMHYIVAFGYTDFKSMLESGFEDVMTVVKKVLDTWPITGLVLVPFVIWAVVAVTNKFRS